MTFQVATGVEFMAMPDRTQETPSSASLAEWVDILKATWVIERKVLEKAREVQNRQADKKRVPQSEFRVGDKVYIDKVPKFEAALQNVGIQVHRPFPYYLDCESGNSGVGTAPKYQAHSASFSLQFIETLSLFTTKTSY